METRPSDTETATDSGSLLLVDDDENVLTVLSDLLTSEGFTVTTCSDPRAAISELERGTFQVVLTDIVMPGLDGMNFGAWVKQNHPWLDVIFITGHASIDTVIQALRLGAADYLPKPLPEVEILGETVRRVIARQRDRADTAGLGDRLTRVEESYRLLSERWNLLTANAPITVVQADIQGRIVFVNHTPAAARDRVNGSSLYDWLAEESAQPMRAAIEAVVQTGQAQDVETIGLGPPSERRRYLTRIGPIREAGKISGFVMVVNDITEQRQAEQTLRDSEARFRVLFEQAPDAYYINDFRGTFIDGNRVAEDLTGYSRDELVGKNMLSTGLLDSEEIEQAAGLLLRSIQGQATGPDELHLVRKDGVRTPVEIRTFPVNLDGQDYVLGIARDITERRQAEQERRELLTRIERTAEEWRRTVDEVDGIIILLDAQGRIVRLNKKACQVLGQPPDTCTGRDIRTVGSGLPWQTVADQVERLGDGEQPRALQARDEVSGQTWDVSIQRSEGFDGQAMIVVVAVDVTELVELQEAAHRNAVLSAMGSLMSDFAHEVRNPLFGVIATLDALATRIGERAGFTQYFDVIRRDLDRIKMLVSDLSEYGRPTSTRLVPGKLRPIVDQAVEMCSRLATESEVEISVRISDGIRLELDEDRLLRCIRNLVENAVQHCNAGDSVSIEATRITRQDQTRIACTVTDSGAGISERDLERVFEPFFSRRKGGTGLGLAIAQRVITEHGGEIRVQNARQGGTVVTLEFPAPDPQDSPSQGGS